MAESSLSLARTELHSAIARFCGWPPIEYERTTAQNTRVIEIERAGLRQFYTAHDWQFLKIVYGTLALAADDWQYDAPDDLAYIIGDITIDDGAEWHDPIENRGEEAIRRLRQANDSITDTPKYFGLAPKTFTGVTGTRWEIQFYPTPNAALDVTFAYAPQGNALTVLLPYPRGGAAHAETIKASCLAIAEREHKNVAEGPEWKNYERLLAQSIRHDGQTTPRNFGYNGDGSERREPALHESDWTADPTS